MTAPITPRYSEASDPFWEGTESGRYLVQWCDDCGQPIFFPRPACPRCLGDQHLSWRESSGAGTVYAVSVQHRPAHPALADQVPYAVVLVDLDAGADDGAATIRIMANTVNTDPSSVQVDDAVALTWLDLEDGRRLAVFEPAEATDG